MENEKGKDIEYNEVEYITIIGHDGLTQLKNNEEPRWHIYEVVISLVLIMAFVFFCTWALKTLFPQLGDGLLMTLSSWLQTAAFIVAAFFVTKGYHSQPVKILGFRRIRLARVLPKAILWGVVLYLISILVSVIVSQIIYVDDEMQAVMKILAGESSMLIRGGIVFAIIVLAPFGEELFFRAFFYQAFRRRLGVKAGVLISGAVFAGLHLELLSFFPLFAVGIGLALLYQKYQNIWYNIFVHAVFNSISVILFFLVINYI